MKLEQYGWMILLSGMSNLLIHTTHICQTHRAKPAVFPASVTELQMHFQNSLLIKTISNWYSKLRELSQDSEIPTTIQNWVTKQQL